MISIEEFGEMLDEMTCELPKEFFEGLNLGVSILDDAKLHPQARGNDLYIMGEYFHDQMGRGILIYYGSFARVHGGLSRPELERELRSTLRHEFRHHMEGRAGESGLEKQDESDLRDYLSGGS